MNKLVRNVMRETVRQASELSKIVTDVPHMGLRGQLREDFLARALHPWLPRGFELGTGVIIDCENNKRAVNQDDLIIYAPDLLPAILPLLDHNIFLIDAVVGHIEVKSTVTSTTLTEAVKGAMSVDELVTKYDGKREVHALFAYETDLQTKSELSRLIEHIDRLGWNKPYPPISLFCVNNSVCYMHGKVQGKPEVGWYDLTPESPEDCMLMFISCLASMVSDQKKSRKFVEIFRFVGEASACKLVKV